MRPHHIIHVSGIAAFLAIATSAVLAYTAYPVGVRADVEPVVAEEAAIPVVADTGSPVAVQAKLGQPIADALARVTKKPFGVEIHPETSPVPNDRFNGYHVGVDFETTEEEKDIDVPIWAICDGPLIAKQFAKGYGGFALQSCEIDGEPVTVVYGHMDLNSISWQPAQYLTRGQTVGVLGVGQSPETDGVRKHLHLGIHRGTETDIRGYVQETSETNQWLDALPYLNH